MSARPDTWQRLTLGLGACWAFTACSVTDPDDLPLHNRRVLSLGGRVAVLAVEATTAARRADPGGLAPAAVGLLAAMGRPEDNVGVILFGEAAGVLLPQTTLAVKRVRPPAVVNQLDMPPLRGKASVAAALGKAQELLEFYQDLSESAVVWIGATPPDDEAAALESPTALFRGRGWRVLGVPLDPDTGTSPALADLTSGTRGAVYAPEAADDLLARVVDVAADLHGLFRRVAGDGTDEVRAPTGARRLLLVALPSPGSDLLGAAAAGGTGGPVWDAWVRRPADGQPAFRVCELAGGPDLLGRAWTPRTVGAVAVSAMAELPLAVTVRPGAPSETVTRAGETPVEVGVRLDAGAEALIPLLTVEAAFMPDAPVVLAPRGSVGGELTFGGLLLVPDRERPPLTIRVRISDPVAGDWILVRRLDLRTRPPVEKPPTPEVPPVFEVTPPTLELGPQWADRPGAPAAVEVRAPAGERPLKIRASVTGPFAVDAPAFDLAPAASRPLALTVRADAPAGALAGTLTVRAEAGRGEATTRTVEVRGLLHVWSGPASVDFGVLRPGARGEASVPAPWLPVPAGAVLDASVSGPDGRTLAVATTVTSDGALALAVTAPSDAVAGDWRGTLTCAGEGLTARLVPLSLRIEAAAPGPGPEVPPVRVTGLVAAPARLDLRGDAGALVEAAVELVGDVPSRVETSDLVGVAGLEMIAARFDCTAVVEVDAGAGGKPRVRLRLRLPADLASGQYTGELRLVPLTGATVAVPVAVEVP